VVSVAASQSELIAKLQEENSYLQKRLSQYEGAAGQQAYQTAGPMCNEANMLRQQTPEEVIDFLFTFHDDPDKTPHYVEIRESAKQFAKVVVRHTPFAGPDRVTAVQKIREAVMFANACVALSGRGL
jgi:hypothetical protein